MSDNNSPWSQPDNSSRGNGQPEQGRDPFTGRPYPAEPAEEDIATTRHIRQPQPQSQSGSQPPSGPQPYSGPQAGPQPQATPSRPPQGYPGQQYPGQQQYSNQPPYSGSQQHPGPQQYPTGSSAVDASAPKAKSRLPLLLTVGLLALALVATGIYFLTRGGDDKTGPAATPVSTQPTQQSTSSSPEETSTAPSSETSTESPSTSESPSSTDSPSGTDSPSATESSASSGPSGNAPADPGQWKNTSAAGLKPPTEFSVWKKTDTSATASLINVYQRSDGVPGGMVVMVIPVGDGSQARARLRNPTVVNGAVCGDASPEGSKQPSNVCVIDLGGGGYVTATSSELGGSPESVGKDLDEWMKKASA